MTYLQRLVDDAVRRACQQELADRAAFPHGHWRADGFQKLTRTFPLPPRHDAAGVGNLRSAQVLQADGIDQSTIRLLVLGTSMPLQARAGLHGAPGRRRK